jgi:hypothetical protein
MTHDEEPPELIYVGPGVELTPEQVQLACARWLQLFDSFNRNGSGPFRHWSRDPSYYWAKRTRKNPLR